MPSHYSDDPRVQAIRNDPQVGRGSLSSIDETMTDEELLETLNELEKYTPQQAVRWAKDSERLWREQMEEHRPMRGYHY